MRGTAGKTIVLCAAIIISVWLLWQLDLYVLLFASQATTSQTQAVPDIRTKVVSPRVVLLVDDEGGGEVYIDSQLVLPTAGENHMHEFFVESECVVLTYSMRSAPGSSRMGLHYAIVNGKNGTIRRYDTGDPSVSDEWRRLTGKVLPPWFAAKLKR